MVKPGKQAPMRIAFLYNHDAPHQIAHSAAIARDMARLDDTVTVDVLATSQALLDHARTVICGDDGDTTVSFRLLPPNRIQSLIGRMVDRFAPFSRVLNLIRHRTTLGRYDAIVVPERTSLFLGKLLGPRTPKLIYTRHGSGDRSIGFKPSVGRFDLVLFSGPKTRDRFLETGYLQPRQTAIVGYPKFDTVDMDAGSARKFFDNDRPTVLYNPNPDPALSSFYDMGLEVLDYFYRSDRYNLIFAPHVMLFRRKLHISIENLKVRRRGAIPDHFRTCPHILIDTDSPALMDMSYTLAADVYVGDVSSQVYEFIIRPRPCIFLNAHGANWRDNPDYLFWTMGPVITSMEEFDRALEQAAADTYRDRQILMQRETFDLKPQPGSQRAARAIVDFMESP